MLSPECVSHMIPVCWTAVSSTPWIYGTVDGRELVHEASVQPSSQALLSRGRRPHCCLIQKGCYWFLLSRTGGAVHSNASMLRSLLLYESYKSKHWRLKPLKKMMCFICVLRLGCLHQYLGRERCGAPLPKRRSITSFTTGSWMGVLSPRALPLCYAPVTSYQESGHRRAPQLTSSPQRVPYLKASHAGWPVFLTHCTHLHPDLNPVA